MDTLPCEEHGAALQLEELALQANSSTGVLPDCWGESTQVSVHNVLLRVLHTYTDSICIHTTYVYLQQKHDIPALLDRLTLPRKALACYKLVLPHDCYVIWQI